MNGDEVDYWLNLCYQMAENIEKEIQKARNDPNLMEITKMGADGTPTHKIDEYAENAAIYVLEHHSDKSLILISEEIGKIKIGNDNAEVVLIMDPLDGTSNAMKNIPCYGISIAIAKLENEEQLNELTLNDIEIGFVKNISTSEVYVSVKGQGAFKDGQPIKTSKITKASEATVSTYIYRAERGRLDKLCSSIRRMRLLGAIAIELCYVADGTYDTFLDIGAVRILDIAAAQLILKENGGIVTDIDSKPLINQLNLTETTSLVASANKSVHEDIIKLIK